MPRFAANLSWLFQEATFLDRFACAAEAGFRAVEILFPYDWPAEKIASALARNGLELVLINLPPGNFAAGDRGLGALAERAAQFRESVSLGLEYLQALNCSRLHVMSGIAPVNAASRATLVENLRYTLERTASTNCSILLEPINDRDFPGYFLTTLEQAASVIAEIDHPRLQIQLDWYHAQIKGGDLARRTRKYLSRIGHLQVASVPNRVEPDEGEINFRHLFQLVDELNYRGWIGCEYRPRKTTQSGLGWLNR